LGRGGLGRWPGEEALEDVPGKTVDLLEELWMGGGGGERRGRKRRSEDEEGK
jgi:hypothetical protein